MEIFIWIYLNVAAKGLRQLVVNQISLLWIILTFKQFIELTHFENQNSNLEIHFFHLIMVSWGCSQGKKII